MKLEEKLKREKKLLKVINARLNEYKNKYSTTSTQKSKRRKQLGKLKRMRVRKIDKINDLEDEYNKNTSLK